VYLLTVFNIFSGQITVHNYYALETSKTSSYNQYTNSCCREPTVDGTDNGPAWPAFTSIEESSLLHIDSVSPKIVKNPFQEKYKFWKGLPLHSRLEKLAALKKSNIKSEL